MVSVFLYANKNRPILGVSYIPGFMLFGMKINKKLKGLLKNIQILAMT